MAAASEPQTNGTPTQPQNAPGSYPKAEKIADFEIRAGATTRRDLIDQIVDRFWEFDPTQSPSEALRETLQIIRPRWEAKLREQESWPRVTDADKLTLCFNRLERNHKILARMNWSCCNTCGVAELRDDRDEDETVGYVFFHEQDMERVFGIGDRLFLSYGSFSTRSAEKCRVVGEKVVRSLRRAGLRPKWDGSPRRCIELEGINWLKRLPESWDDEESDAEDDAGYV